MVDDEPHFEFMKERNRLGFRANNNEFIKFLLIFSKKVENEEKAREIIKKEAGK